MTELEIAKDEALKGMISSGICTTCRSFDNCVKRIGCLPPPAARGGGMEKQPIRSFRFFGWRFYLGLVAFVVALFSSLCLFGMSCTLEGDGEERTIYCYIDEQWSSSIFIPPCSNGGNEGGGGSCASNCLNMTVAEMRQFKSQSSSLIGGVLQLTSTIYTIISNALEDAQSLVDAPNGLRYYTGSMAGTAAGTAVRTNFINNVVGSVPDTNFVKLAYNSSLGHVGSGSSVSASSYQVGAWNGALSYAQDASSRASDIRQELAFAQDSLITIKENAEQTRDLILALPETQCPAGNCDDSGVSPDGSYDWCTVEQGDAIIELFEDVSSFLYDELKPAVERIDGNIKRLLDSFNSFSLSSYYAIPKELYSGSFTNRNWKTYYLTGGDDDGARDFGYSNTNILQRIELLLYGLSGVSDDDAEPLEDFNSNTLSNFTSSVNHSLDAFSGSFLDESAQRIDTVLQAFNSFFDSFSGLSGREASAQDTFIPSTEVTVGDDSITVPSFTFGDEDSVSLFASVAEISRVFCTILYLLTAAILCWNYWSWFASWAIRFAKWACELLGNLFAS